MRQQLSDGNHPGVIEAREGRCLLVMWYGERGPLSSLDQLNAEMRPGESTVESQLSLQKVAGTVSPVSSVCLLSALCLSCSLSVFDGSSRPVRVEKHTAEEGVVTSCLCLVFDSSTHGECLTVSQVARTTAQEVVVCLAKIRQKMFSRKRTWIIRACDRGDLFFQCKQEALRETSDHRAFVEVHT